MGVKHLWLEDVSGGTAAQYNGLISLSVFAAGSQTSLAYSVPPSIVSLSPYEFLSDYGYTINPNPTSEDVVYSFNVPSGQFAFICTQHVATECVPEPSALALLAAGAFGLVGYGWRRRATRTAKPVSL